MANPIIRIKRGATAPVATLNAGEFAIDQAAKNLYLGVEVGGVTTNEIVGGEGTFATKDYVTNVTGSLGTMSQQNADSVAITGGTMDGVSISMGTVFGANLQTVAIGSSSYIADSTIENTPIGATTPSTGAFTTLTASSAPSASNDVVRKTDLDTAISALGSVFHYVGDVSSATTPSDLTTLSDTTTGAYYKVDADGIYTDGATAFNAKVGDAFVKTSTGWQKLDNVDAVVSGTANEIAVTGDENAGYTVAIDSAFSGRVSTAETDIDDLQTKTQNISVAGTTTGVTNFNDTELQNVGAIYASDIAHLEGVNIAELVAPEVILEATTAVTIAGPTLAGNGTTELTDFIIDGGTF
jgi:trimeric autotransporter adhesin